MTDKIIRAVNKAGTLRAFAASTTELTERARQIHDTYPVVSAAMGRLLTAAAMMGITLKGERETISLQIKGDGPIGGIVVVSDSSANVRGYVFQNKVDLPPRSDHKLDVGRAVGNGFLTVIRDLGMKEPYVGRVELQTGEIAEDLTYYFASSEQVPSAVALGVLVDRDWSIKAAGGYIVQLMPDASEEDVAALEKNIERIQPISTMIAAGMSPEEVLEQVLHGVDYSITDTLPCRYQCNCSREKLEKTLISLGKDELEDIIRTQGKAEVTCYFCNQKYDFSKEELEKLLQV